MFDFPSECESQVLNYWTDGKFDTLCKATELPELQEKERPFSPGGRGGRGRGSFGGAAETFPVTTTDLEGGLGGEVVLAGEGALVAEEGSKDQVTLGKQVRKTRKFVFRKS